MIEIIQHGSIHEINLARPPVNAMNFDLLDALTNAIEAAPANGARGLILSGGEKVFSGGLDVPYLMSLDKAGLLRCWSRFFDAARALANSSVPVVAAIAGHNPAGGCVLALCCDYRVMARGPFRIGLNETQVGLAVPEAIQYLMRRVVGAQRAERLIVAGAMVESELAHQIGLVDELCDQANVIDAAKTWLDATLALPSSPMLATRKIARADVVHALSSFKDADLEMFVAGWYSADTQAALKAMMMKLGK
ncbi:MAG: enoyl-CoA hydratase/isomerase family protein [Arenimonas sp.]